MENFENIDFSDRTILICDDDPTYRKYLNKIIITLLQAKVAAVSNPNEMFEYLENNQPDLLILDLQLPIMDGYTALSIIRDNPKTYKLQVLICSVLGYESVVHNIAPLNISGFIIKPFETITAITKISQILNKIES